MYHRPILEDNRRLTTTEEVFRRLYLDIISLQLAPGARLSEVDVAKSFGISRQPVREAFMRLGNLNLLHIRPQKATLVPKISLQGLQTTRFIRAAVEVEVVRRACHVATQENLALIEANLQEQQAAARSKDPLLLQELDYEFHRLVCNAADCLPAFKTIAENKAHTDRVCTLELADLSGMADVIEGHTNILAAIRERDEEKAVAATRHHLSHLDETLLRAQKNQPDYFED